MANLLAPIDIFSDELCLSQPLATRILQSALQRGRLQQGYLLTGGSINDKWQIVISLAGYLNCSKRQGDAKKACLSQTSCNRESWCLNCRWIAEKEHPQALRLLTTDGSKSGKIAVEKARELSEELSKTSQYYRVAVIENADQDSFHRPAANALLKTLEEPKSTCLIFLFALAADNVLPTIVSRCQVIQLKSSNLAELAMFVAKPNTTSLNQLDEQKRLELEQACEKLRCTKTRAAGLACIAFAESLTELLEAETTFDNIIDLVLLLEAKSLTESQFGKLKITLYAKRLLDLCELTKLQVKHYVSKRAAVEAFAFALKQLQVEFNIDK